MATPKKAAPDPSTLTETFGDEDQDLSRFEEDKSPGVPRRTVGTLTPEQIDRITMADDPLQALAEITAELNLEIEDASTALGDVFTVIPKEHLVNVGFTILDWKFPVSQEHGTTFSAVRCMRNDGMLFVFTDGGSGIHERLMTYYMKHGRTGIIACPNGMKISEYPRWEDEERTVPLVGPNGEQMRGRTFYIA